MASITKCANHLHSSIVCRCKLTQSVSQTPNVYQTKICGAITITIYRGTPFGHVEMILRKLFQRHRSSCNIKMYILCKYTLNVTLSAILKSPDINSIRPRLGSQTILSVCRDHLLIHAWRTTSLPLEVRNPLIDISHTKIKSIFNCS